MAVVLLGGVVRSGNAIAVELPPPSHALPEPVRGNAARSLGVETGL
jgi:hypothetical protein